MAFAIRYLSRPQTRWKWIGRGEIAFDHEQVSLRGRRHRPFMFGSRQEVTLARASFYNVASEAALVRCEVRVADAPDQSLRFRAQDAAAAQEIVASLPDERTAQFTQEQSERDTFHQALNTLSPRALATPVLVTLNVAVFLGTLASGAGLVQSDPTVLVRWGSNFGPYTLDGQWWRLFTAMFLHFGVAHLLFNMLGLWSLGSLTERLYGGRPFLFIYLASGLCGSLASLFWHPLLNSAGASGAIFGVLGALLAFMVNPRTRIAPHIANAQRNSALIFIAYNLLNGVTHAGIDNAAHVGGLVSGFAVGWLLALPLDPQVRREAGRRLALASAAVIALISGVAWWMIAQPGSTAQERDFRREFLQFVREEAVLETQRHDLSVLAQQQHLSDATVGQRVAETLVPRWQAALEHMDATHLPPGSRFAPLRADLLEYIEGQRLGLELVAQGLQSDRKDKIEWGAGILQKGPARRQEIQSLSRTLY
jgi:rhomboid protease GluP